MPTGRIEPPASSPPVAGLVDIAELASYVCAPVWRRLVSDPSALREAECHWEQAALLLADITGFTPLATRLAERGSAGAEELSRLLDDYFGELLALVRAHGGEALSFAGDALLAQWPASAGGVGAATRRAAVCALAVQRRLFRHDAGDGITLSMRVSVAAGEIAYAHVRAGATWHLVVEGEPLARAARAQRLAGEGETVAGENAWQWLAASVRGVPLADGAWRLEGLLDRGASDDAGTAMAGADEAGAAGKAADETHVATVESDASPALPGSAATWTVQAVDQLARHVPAPVHERLAAGQAKWLAELRRVSPAFVRLTGVQATGAGWPQCVQDAVHRAQALADRLEGTIKEIVIEPGALGLIVIFGLPPWSHEDDPVRALRFVLALDAAFGGQVEAGVTSGRCFCGLVGSDVRREYTVLGDAMNLAARLLDASPRLACDAATRRASLDAVAFEVPEPIQVKGRTRPVEVARPLHLLERAPAAETALIGRARERAAIDETLARAAGGRRPGTLLIVGEAGIGKSRLAAELLQAARDAGVAMLSSSGDAIESTTPYFAWRLVFAALVGLQGDETPDARRAAIERWLGPDWAPQAPLFGALFAVGGGDTPQTGAWAGPARAHATRELLLATLGRAAAARPLGIVLENAHWFDPGSFEFALEAGRRIEPLLLVLTTRPLADGTNPAFAALQAEPHCTLLALGPLDEQQTLALACRRLGAQRLHDEVAAVIRARAAGHPFFAEQLASTLRETGVVVVEGGVGRLAREVDADALAFPETVRGLVTSRIDRLPPREQLVLKVASVIGPQFLVELVRAVHPLHADLPELGAALEALREAALTVLAAPEPELAYAFSHVITHEVAYDLLLFAQRRVLHHAIAEWYERAWRDDRPELLGLLAHHWSRAGVLAKAVAYLEKSSLRSFNMGFTGAAVDQGLQAARLLGVTLPRRHEDIVALIGDELQRIERLLAGRAPQALLDLPPLADADTDAAIGVMLRTLPAIHVSGQAELFALVAARCMSLTLEHGNGSAAPLVYAMHSIVYRGITQDTSTAVAFSRLSLELDARQGRHLFAPVAFIHHYFNQHWTGPIDACIGMAGDGADAGFAAGDLMYGCFNSAAQVIYLACAGRPVQEVMEAARRAHARIGGRVMNAAWHCVLELQVAKALAGRTAGISDLTDGEFDEARDLASMLDTDIHEESGWYCATKVRLHYLAGEIDDALAWATRALGFLHAVGGQYTESELAVFRALALLARATEPAAGDASAARLAEARGIVDGVRAWHAVGPRSFAHRLALIEGELARAEGRADDALRHFAAAAGRASELGQLQYAGIAHERRAALLCDLGDAGAREAAGAARAAFAHWGAAALAARIDRRYGAQALHLP